MTANSPRTIQIIVAPDGQTRVETLGFVGSSCRDASRFLEAALGRLSPSQLKPEFHQTTESHTHLHHDT